MPSARIPDALVVLTKEEATVLANIELQKYIVAERYMSGLGNQTITSNEIRHMTALMEDIHEFNIRWYSRFPDDMVQVTRYDRLVKEIRRAKRRCDRLFTEKSALQVIDEPAAGRVDTTSEVETMIYYKRAIRMFMYVDERISQNGITSPLKRRRIVEFYEHIRDLLSNMGYLYRGTPTVYSAAEFGQVKETYDNLKQTALNNIRNLRD